MFKHCLISCQVPGTLTTAPAGNSMVSGLTITLIIGSLLYQLRTVIALKWTLGFPYGILNSLQLAINIVTVSNKQPAKSPAPCREIFNNGSDAN
jgi:hypothetical protein